MGYSTLLIKKIFLSGNKISDITLLAQLSQLEAVDLDNNNIKNVDALARLPKLKGICLRENAIKDLSPLKGLENLREVNATDQKCVNDAVVYQPNLVIPNTVRNAYGMILPAKVISNKGKYVNNAVTWELPTYVKQVNYWFSETIPLGEKGDFGEDEDEYIAFSGLVIQPLGFESTTTWPINAVFPDSNLAEVIKESLGKKDVNDLVSEQELHEMKEIHAKGKGIRSIEGMQYLFNLKKLNLSDNQIRDIRPLGNLTCLTELYLDSNELEDASAVTLTGIKNLEVLSIRDNNIHSPRTIVLELYNLRDFNWSKKAFSLN
nr:leucine-rich repeat domain-containing protein [Listeria ivanovii]